MPLTLWIIVLTEAVLLCYKTQESGSISPFGYCLQWPIITYNCDLPLVSEKSIPNDKMYAVWVCVQNQCAKRESK